MGRPTKTINPERGRRVKVICDKEGIKHAELARRINIAPQTLSKIITGKASLTYTVAGDIVSAFPNYRIEWLLDLDSFSTEKERRLWEGTQIAFDKYNGVMETAYHLLIQSVLDSCPQYSYNPISSCDNNSFGYMVSDDYGNSTILESGGYLKELKKELQDFAAFKITRYIKNNLNREMEDRLNKMPIINKEQNGQ